MTHITCRLTAKNRDQLRNPTLGNRVWPTFTFFNAGKKRNGLSSTGHILSLLSGRYNKFVLSQAYVTMGAGVSLMILEVYLLT